MIDKRRHELALLLVWVMTAPPKRAERGLSQSTENAILLAGAVSVATLVITVVYAFVNGRMPQ